MSIKFFISYSNEDRNKMEAIKKAIESIDKEYEALIVAKRLSPGLPLNKKVEQGIDESTFFVPILTVDSKNSQWVNQEIGYANAQGKILLPIIDIAIRDELRGFIHNQMDLPFCFESNHKNKRREASNFRKCYKELIKFVKNSVVKFEFESSVSPKKVKQGEPYSTKVKFKGRLNYGFFDNYVKHLEKKWDTWNWDKSTLDNTGPSAPGKLSGKIIKESKYKWSTKNWPKGKYKIYVGIYDHLTPGIPGRVLVAQQEHNFEII